MKTSVFLSVLFFFFLTGCEKKYETDDISTFEFNYSTGSIESDYQYYFQLSETGVLDIRFIRSNFTNHSIYLIDNNDMVEFKPYLVNLLNSKIKADYYVEPGQITDIPPIGINLRSNLKQVETLISGPNPELPESLDRILEEVSVLQAKYDTLVKF
jgi:hypothetical protein